MPTEKVDIILTFCIIFGIDITINTLRYYVGKWSSATIESNPTLLVYSGCTYSIITTKFRQSEKPSHYHTWDYTTYWTTNHTQCNIIRFHTKVHAVAMWLCLGSRWCCDLSRKNLPKWLFYVMVCWEWMSSLFRWCLLLILFLLFLDFFFSLVP